VKNDKDKNQEKKEKYKIKNFIKNFRNKKFLNYFYTKKDL